MLKGVAKAMLIFYLVLVGVVLLGAWAGQAFGAERLADDYPYRVYKEGKDIYYCMEWTTEKRTACYMRGKKLSCDTRKLEDNILDCRPESWG